MIRTDAQISEQQLLATRMVASAVRFHGHKYRIDIPESFRIVSLQNPTLLAHIVLVENSQTESLLPVRTPPAPCLKRTRILHARLCIQIKGIENQGFSFCVKHASVGL